MNDLLPDGRRSQYRAHRPSLAEFVEFALQRLELRFQAINLVLPPLTDQLVLIANFSERRELRFQAIDLFSPPLMEQLVLVANVFEQCLQLGHPALFRSELPAHRRDRRRARIRPFPSNGLVREPAHLFQQHAYVVRFPLAACSSFAP